MIEAPAAGRLENAALNTQYFEIKSAYTGDTFAISVFLPRQYADDDAAYPLLYMTDGNIYAPISESVMPAFMQFDAVPRAEPFLQVNIGFPADQAQHALTLRMRNFGLPGATVPDYMAAHTRQRLGPEAAHAGIEQFRNGQADKFLAFIEEELHPEILRRFRIKPDAVGLFGYSAGGLFSLYGLVSGSRIFSRYGVSAPGVFSDDCMIFSMYEERLRCVPADDRQIHLHLSINSLELFGLARLYRLNMVNLLRFYDMLLERPLPGLRITTDVVAGESHYTGFVDAYRSFVRGCYT